MLKFKKIWFPSLFVKKAVLVSEKILTIEMKKNWLMKKYYFDYVNIQICNAFVSLHSNLFLTMDNHCYELLKKIVSCYTSIRFKSHAREQNEILKKNRLRSMLNKIILHSHQ